MRREKAGVVDALIHRKKYSSAHGAGRHSGPAAIRPNRRFITRLLQGLELGCRMNVGLTNHASSHPRLNMKKPISFAVAIALATSLVAASAADWYAPQDPFALYGNTYFVGTGGISAVLITSPAGHVLIDGGPTGSSAQIAGHVRKLGFKVEDIRYILSGHEHFDHAGGIAELQKMAVRSCWPARHPWTCCGPASRTSATRNIPACERWRRSRKRAPSAAAKWCDSDRWLSPLTSLQGIRWARPAGPGNRTRAAGR
jgi:hypothetical protein